MREMILKDRIKFGLYKSFLYKNVVFKSESEDPKIIAIAEALNIKKRNKRIEYIYDFCSKYLDQYYEGKNII